MTTSRFAFISGIAIQPKTAPAHQTGTLRPRDRIRFSVHIADNNGNFDDHLPPFYCRVDFKEIMGALREVGFAGTFNFEAHNCCNKMPDELRVDAARMLYRIGEYIVTHY